MLCKCRWLYHVKLFYLTLFAITTVGAIARPVLGQGAFATTVTTFQVSPTGHTLVERSINDSTQNSQSSVSLTTDSSSGSTQTSNSENGTTTQTNYSYGATSTSVSIETANITRQIEIEVREEFDFNESLIINNAITGYSF